MADYAWDFLRPLAEAAVAIDPYIKIVVFLLAVGMLFLAASAYRKTSSKKFLFIAGAFSFFALKWLLKILDVFVSPGSFFSDSSENVFELLIFASLFLAVFRK